MSVAYYIVSREEPDDLDIFVNGKALGHLDEHIIENLCAAANVPSLLSFLSQSPEELEDFLDDEAADAEADADFPAEEWFTAEAGLTTVRALIKYLQKTPQAVDNAADVIEDLLEYESVLAQLAERKMLWHLALDF